MIQGIKNNTLQGLWEWYMMQAEPVLGLNEAKAAGRLLFEHFYNLTLTDFVLQKDRRFSESEIVTLYKALKQLTLHLPVQYITGKAFFRDLELGVNPSVLIPRGETEELVEWVLEDFRSPMTDGLICWDIGTGSGAIALSLAGEIPGSKVFASDISPKALETARTNALKNKLEVTFFEHNILKDTSPDIQPRVIVSNPPYVRNAEKQYMKSNVLEHEPHLALFVSDDDPLVFYRAIARQAAKILQPGGCLYVEINEALAGETARIFELSGFLQVSIRKDLHDKDRFVKGVKYDR